MKVICWIDYDNYSYGTAEGTEEEINAVAEDIRENGYKFGGNDHEDHANCCPVLSNGKALRMSWRGWGYVMAVAYDLKTDVGKYNYILWYMGEYGPEKRVYPKGREVKEEDKPIGKTFVYELHESEVHAVYNASFCQLALPAVYFESVGLKAFDKVVFKENGKTVLTATVSGDRFIRCTVKEYCLYDDDIGFYPNENGNYRDFDEEKMKEFIKYKQGFEGDGLVAVSLDLDKDERDPDKLYV